MTKDKALNQQNTPSEESAARMVAEMLHSFSVADGIPAHMCERGETYLQRSRRILARLHDSEGSSDE